LVRFQKNDECCRVDGEMIVRPAEPHEYAQIHDLLKQAFRHSELESTMIRVSTEQDPNFRKEDLRVVEAAGRIVSMMLIIRRPLRIGTAIVNGAIVGPVATHPDHRNRGYCSAVMRDAVQYMKAQGFAMAILWGISWLYPHYGYSPAMAKTEIVLKPDQGSSVARGEYKFRPFDETDLQQMTHIYHNNTSTKTCSEVRSPEMWEWKPGGSKVRLDVLSDRRKGVMGYVVTGTDWGRPCAHEIGVLNEEACGAILSYLLGMMRQMGLKEFYCLAHPDQGFSRFAFWHGGEMRIQSGGGAGMAQVLNLASLLTGMVKEFERRLRCSEFHRSQNTLGISSDGESASLEISRGRVSIATGKYDTRFQLAIPLADLNPLITGYKSIQELAKNTGVKVRGGKKALRLTEVLFPTGFPSGGFLPTTWE